MPRSAKDLRAEFLRHQAEKAWDTIELARIRALEEQLVDYAANAWRDIDAVPPPLDTPILCVGSPAEGVIVMILHPNGDWRCAGQPHKPPTLWMPCPQPPENAAAKLTVAK
jgi:hypothetical protein